jgi:hypothetical protein
LPSRQGTQQPQQIKRGNFAKLIFLKASNELFGCELKRIALFQIEQYWHSAKRIVRVVKKPKTLSDRALLASLKKEFAQPRVVKSARAGYVKVPPQIVTRQEFEAKPGWAGHRTATA